MKILHLLFTSTLLAATWGYGIQPRDDLTCTESGLKCSDECDSILFCGSAEDLPIKLFQCPPNALCSTQSGEPVCDSTQCGLPSQPCTQQGSLPSPFNCSQYYICSKLGQSDPPFLATCEVGSVFDTTTNVCSDTIECRDPVDCTVSQEGFVDPTEEKFRYICDPSGFPIVFPNPDAAADGDNSTTTEPPPSDNSTTIEPPTNDNSTTTEPPTSDNSTTTEPPIGDNSTTTEPPTSDNSTTVEPTTIAPVQCTVTGERFPVPGDCNSFYQCNRPGDTSPTQKKCPPGFFYNPNAFACVRGSCPEAWWWTGGSFYGNV